MPKVHIDPDKLDPKHQASQPPPDNDDPGGYWYEGNWHQRGNEMHQKPFVPSEQQVNLTRELAGLGVPHIHIARLIGTSIATLHKYLQDVLDDGHAIAIACNAKFCQQAIIKGDTKVLMWWMAIHAGWVIPKEAPADNPNEQKEAAELTDDELDSELNWLKEAQDTVATSRALATRLPR